MEEIKRERSFSGILKDKGITEYLEMLDPVLRKTRVMMGKAKIATGRSQELSQGIINPNILWIDVFVFLVCSKSKVNQKQKNSKFRKLFKKQKKIDQKLYKNFFRMKMELITNWSKSPNSLPGRS